MLIKPGINQINIMYKSFAELKKTPIFLPVNKIRAMKIILMEILISKDEDAITAFCSPSMFAVTNFICAFFNRALFVFSNTVIIVRKRAQVPI